MPGMINQCTACRKETNPELLNRITTGSMVGKCVCDYCLSGIIALNERHEAEPYSPMYQTRKVIINPN